MKILFILILCLIEGEMEAQAIGYSYYKGGTVIIEQRSVRRDFCKKMTSDKCPNLADKGLNGRLSVEQSENRDSTTVSIHSLKREDEGDYRFGHQLLELELLPGPSGQNRTQDLSSVVGDSVSITCDFPVDHARSGTFLCKGENSLTCNRLYPNKNKYSFTDGRKGNDFKVTIKNPQESDAGVYWCGSYFTHNSLTYDSLYQAITITGTPHSRETTTTATTTLPTSWSTSPPGVTGVMDSESNLAIWLLVPLVMLLLGTGLLVVVKCKKTSRPAPTSPDIPIYTNTAENTQGTGDYVNAGVQEPQANTPTGPIRSNRPNSDPDYQNSNMSDTTTYQTLIASTRQNDSIYHTLHPRTNQQ